MTADTSRALRMTRRFDASPERVFDAWLDPAMVGNGCSRRPRARRPAAKSTPAWAANGPSPTGARAPTTRGAASISRSTDRPRRLVFTFGMPQFSPNSDRITVEIAPDGDGCLLTFTQEGVDIAEELRQVPPGAKGGSEQGWAQMLGRLAAALV